MNKLTLLLCLLLLGIGSALADTYHSLVIMNKDGSEFSIAHQDGMKMTFSDQTLTLAGRDVESKKRAEFTYSFADIEGFKFSTAEGDHQFSGIEDVAADSPALTINGTSVTVRNLKPGETVSVYGIDGRTMFTTRADGDGVVTLDMSNYANRTVVVKAGIISYTTIVKQ